MTVCKTCSAKFEIQNFDREFYKRFDVPEPEICPICRNRLRLSFKNEQKISIHECGICKKRATSLYPDYVKFPVYCSNCWHGDKWDPLDYGRDFDFSRGFFEQMKELDNDVPHWSNIMLNSQNSEYVMNCANMNNCYLMVSSIDCEDCMYGLRAYDSRDCLDTLELQHSELCYECMDCSDLYSCSYMQSSKNCSYCNFGYELFKCENCFLCAGLWNKKFHILNKEYSEEEYKKEKEKLLKNGVEWCKSELKKLISEVPHRANHIINSENCTGDFITNSKNILNGYFVSDSENTKNVFIGNRVDLSLDASSADVCTDNYETATIYKSTSSAFVFNTANAVESFYCSTCDNIMNCFGCVGLNRKQYCILNKQYLKEDYEKMKERIIDHMKKTGEWGRFFPPSVSPFAYNNSVSYQYYPLVKEEAEKLGYMWAEDDPKEYKEPSGDILTCEKCRKNYKIIAQEDVFYKKLKIDKPKKCIDCRVQDRFSKRNPNKLYLRDCDNCSKEIKTTYSPDRPEKVHCEQCYLKEVA